jgi:hypothetical protein
LVTTFGRGGVGVQAIGTGWIVGQRIAGEDASDCGIGSDDEDVAGEGAGVEAIAFELSGDRQDLGGAEHLAKALVLAEVKGLAAAVVDVRDDDRAAVGEAEFVAAKWRDSSGIGDGGVVEVVAGVERGVPQELEDRAVKAAAAGAGDDVGEAAAPRPISAGIQPETVT